MLRRLPILMILASWSFAWFSASVHVHYPGHDCLDDGKSAVPHVHSGSSHSHCHAHSGFHAHGGLHAHSGPGHHRSADRQSPDTAPPEPHPSVSGVCPLCDLTALELSTLPVTSWTTLADTVAAVRFLRTVAPETAARYALRGRAPPVGQSRHHA